MVVEPPHIGAERREVRRAQFFSHAPPRHPAQQHAVPARYQRLPEEHVRRQGPVLPRRHRLGHGEVRLARQGRHPQQLRAQVLEGGPPRRGAGGLGIVGGQVVHPQAELSPGRVRHVEDPNEPLAQAPRPRAAQAVPVERYFDLRRHGPFEMGNRTFSCWVGCYSATPYPGNIRGRLGEH